MIYHRYLQTIKKNWIFDIIREDGFDAIKIMANKNNIDPYKELNMLNRLYDECKFSDYRFEWFVLTEIISVKKYYDSIFGFKSSRF